MIKRAEEYNENEVFFDLRSSDPVPFFADGLERCERWEIIDKEKDEDEVSM